MRRWMAMSCVSLLSVLGVLANLVHAVPVKTTIAGERKTLVRRTTETSATSPLTGNSLAHSVPIPSGASILSTGDEESDDSDNLEEGVYDFLVTFLKEFGHKTLGTCMKDRIRNASGIRGVRNDHWQNSLAPPVLDDLQQEQLNKGNGVAVLVTGQVRTGIYPDVVQNMRERVFDVLKKRSPEESVEVFAFLAFTTGGYHPWQGLGHTDSNVDISRSDVEKMLEGYGVKYTLEEFTGSERFPDFKAEGCCDDAHHEKDCADDHEMAEQWLKVHGAIEMMKEAEKTRDQRYKFVVRLRPDITVWTKLNLEDPYEHTPGTICASGGGGGDALLTMPRWAVEAVDGMWRVARDCPAPGVDECRTKELVDYCSKKVYADNAMICGHLLWIGLLRYGLPVSGCGQGLNFVRPKSFLLGQLSDLLSE